MVTSSEHTASHSNSITTSSNVKEIAVRFVNDLPEHLKQDLQSITITIPGKSVGYYVPSVTVTSSEGIVTTFSLPELRGI